LGGLGGHRLSGVAGDGGQVEPALAGLVSQQPLGHTCGQRQARLVAADAFGLDLPPGGGCQVGRRQPHLIAAHHPP
jgi:hypothetical protein